MRAFTNTLIVATLILALPVFGWSGVLSESLKAQLSVGSSHDMVSVWIKLHPVENADALKTAALTGAQDRAERYHLVADRLRSNHAPAQAALLEKLETMKSDGRARNIREHWLVNIVEVEVTASELATLAARTDVEIIVTVPEVELIAPERTDSPPLAQGTAVLGDNLTLIRADEAWAAGWTGEGRLVCSFDTGIDGDHPALTDSWKGNDGDHAAAWFFGREGDTSVPHVVYDCNWPGCTGHGTLTMGLILGHDDATGDTVGVAPGARWISSAAIDNRAASLIDAFEWAADPDGDPNSVDDVPDVINHSWGVPGIDCDEIFFDLIDATEALGIVNIFAAGNEGSIIGGPWQTIANPAVRALDSLDCFAVGNVMIVDPVTVEIAETSSRGPSDCNGAIKPNVSAPGAFVRSCWPNDGYTVSYSGTSLAAPHVSGLVALLRQKNPNATVDEIKLAILNSAQDFGYSLPDNTYGWGVIDCMAALNALPAAAEPSVRVFSFDRDPAGPGATISGTMVLQNLGTAVSSVSAAVTDSDPALTVLQGNAYFGSIGQNDTVRTGDAFTFVVADTVTEGRVLTADLTISGSGGYTVEAQLRFPIEPVSERSWVTHDAGRIEFTISNYGTYGMGEDSWFNPGGRGFRFDGGDNYLYECGLMISTAPNQVSDGVRNISGEPDGDFRVLPGGNISIIEPGPYAFQQTYCRFDDSRAETPVGVEIEQFTYAENTAPDDDFVVMQYLITNTSGATLEDLVVGLYLDWDATYWNNNAGGYDWEGGIAWTAYNDGVDLSDYRGVKILDGPSYGVHSATSALITFDGDGFTEDEKYWAMRSEFATDSTYTLSQTDINQTVSAGPLMLGVGETDTIAFAFVAADYLSGLRTAAENAVSAYGGMIPTDVPGSSNGRLPERFILHQNYPNPFNPTTTISFDLARAGDYRLTIYNVIGQRVNEIAGSASAGTVTLEWDARKMASGLYLYKLTTDDYSATRKMLLLK